MPKIRHRVGRPPVTGVEGSSSTFETKSAEERRALFVEAAARLFATKGYASTSIEDITDELGFSKGIFYYYWTSKKDLLLEIHARTSAMLDERLDLVLHTEQTPERRLEAAIRSYIDLTLANHSLSAILRGVQGDSEETVGEQRAYIERFQRLVEEGITAGVVRDEEARVMTMAILGLCNSIGKWFRSDGKLGPDEITEIILRFARNGYAAL